VPTFKDNNHREWTVAFDGLLLKSLRDQHQIDLADVLSAVYVQLERDPALLTTALAHLCAEQLQQAGLTREQFSRAVVGKALEDGFAALWGAAELFFPPKLWSVLSSLYSQQQKETDARLLLKSLSLLSDMPPEIREPIYAEIGKSLPNIGSLISRAAAGSASGQADTPPSTATSSPASSASTPAA
jgi:hypothetical protein